MSLKRLFAAATSAAILATGALASDWTPPGPINLIIAFRAGGGADTSARLIASQIENDLGWEIIPEQVTGKGGVNALVALKDMPADGTAIAMVVTESLGYNLAAARGAGLAPSDFAGLTTTAGFQMGVVARADKGWSTFDDMIAAAKGGEALSFGTMSPKLADIAFLLGEAQGVEFNIVSVRGGKAVMDGVTAGDLDVGFMAGIQRKGVAAGDLVNLASALSEPLVQTPEAPTIGDLGVPFNADGYFVLMAPAGIPEDARTALTDAIIKASNEGEAGKMLKGAFGGATNISGAELDTMLQNDFDSAGALMEAAQ